MEHIKLKTMRSKTQRAVKFIDIILQQMYDKIKLHNLKWKIINNIECYFLIIKNILDYSLYYDIYDAVSKIINIDNIKQMQTYLYENYMANYDEQCLE